jgi:tRNA modification GTPase
MRRPQSYTGEDVVEIHCHGGAFLTRQILELVFAEGARQAEPGEFTKRAFLNGRMDLAQAEGVLDLIRARTEKSATLALSQTGGALSQRVGEIREALLDILVHVEAAIDFPEEEIDFLPRRDLIARIESLRSTIDTISDTYDWGRLFREGARVTLCGRPNVGKSSLLNALVGEDRAIVTPIPGTTRDVIEETINLDGLPVVLGDTAGLRETDNPIESMGIDFTRRHLEKSDAVIVVLDGSEPLTQDDVILLRSVRHKKFLVAINKNDLPQVSSAECVMVNGCAKKIRLSARTGESISALKEELRDLLIEREVEAPAVITNLRHRGALRRSSEALVRSATALHEKHAPEFVAIDLNEAREALEEITGVIQSDDILERIFSDFCIGK